MGQSACLALRSRQSRFANLRIVLWQLQTAKQKLSEVVDRAVGEGPQIITRRGNEVAVVLSIEDYRGFGANDGFKRLLVDGPTLEGLDLTRPSDRARAVEL